jgi:hypothetical protein
MLRAWFQLQCKRIGCVVLALAVCACQVAGSPRAPSNVRFEGAHDLGTIAVIAAPHVPEVKLQGFASGKGAAALGGAGATLTACLAPGGSVGGCSGGGALGAAICAAGTILWLGVCAVAGGVGAIAGATHADSANSVQANMATVTANLDAGMIQEALREQTEKAAAQAAVAKVVTPISNAALPSGTATDYRSLAAAGVDNVIETSLTRLGTVGRGFDPPLTLYVQAQVRVISTRDNAQRFTAAYIYVSEQHLLKEWAADQSAVLKRAMQTAFVRLGAAMADEVLRGYSFPQHGAHAEESIGLAATHPKTVTSAFHASDIADDSHWNKIDTLEPTLEWQSFPREVDRLAAPDEMARVSDVRYDLVVAEESGAAAGAVIVSAQGVAENRYRIEPPLEPGKKYFWTVRASFKLDGQSRVTQWAASSSGFQWVLLRMIDANALPEKGMLWTPVQPSLASYRFQTPSPQVHVKR